MQLEEGEILEDESSVEYVPLKRPHQALNQNQATGGLPAYSDSSSDHDSDDNVKIPKRQKCSLPPNKYNIWVNEYQEDLALSMDRCGMDNDRGRAIETYPYKLASTSNIFMLNKSSERNFKENLQENKDLREKEIDLCNEETKSIRKRIYKKRKKRPNLDLLARGEPRNLNVLTVTEYDSQEKIASDIADKLNESNRDIIMRSVAVLGKNKAIEFYEKTKLVEQEGGLLIYDRSRKRTSGGVYLFLIRQDRSIPAHQMRAIFDDLRISLSCKDNSKNNLYRRRKLRDKDDTKPDVDMDNQELENPPPSPATDGDLISFLPKGNSVQLNDAIDTLGFIM